MVCTLTVYCSSIYKFSELVVHAGVCLNQEVVACGQQIREDSKTGVYVEGLSEEYVSNLDDVTRLLVRV